MTNTLKTSYLIIGFVLVATSHLSAHKCYGQEINSNIENYVGRSGVVETQVQDMNLSSTQRRDAFDAIQSLPASNQLNLYRKAVYSSDEIIAVLAIRSLMAIEKEKVFIHIEGRLPTLSNSGIRSVLNSFFALSLTYRSPKFFDFAARILKEFLEKQETPRLNISRGTAGIAALFLANGNRTQDYPLISKALDKYPDAMSLWFAASLTNSFTPSQRQLGQKILLDFKSSNFSKSFIALVLGRDEKPELQNIYAFISKTMRANGNKSSSQLLKELDAPDGISSDELTQISMAILSLRFAHSALAKSLVFEAARAKLIDIQEAGALVALDRYPSEFLQKFNAKNWVSEKPNHYSDLLVFLTLQHPQYKSEVVKRLTYAGYQRALKRMEQETPKGRFDLMGAFMGVTQTSVE